MPTFAFAFLQAATSQEDAGSPCITAIITWLPFLLLVLFFFAYSYRVGYFRKRGGYIKRSEEHMDRVEQTLQKIEEHLRKLAERDRIE